MSTHGQRKQLADCGGLSTEAARAQCLRKLSTLPATATAEDIRRVVAKECPALMDEIVLVGARSLTAKLRRKPAEAVDLSALRERRRESDDGVGAAAREIVRRVEVGSAVVELLDSIEVGGKRLGDCTHRDLMAEATTEGRRAAALNANAEWLRRLGAILKPNDTVRTADREAVLALLRERFEA